MVVKYKYCSMSCFVNLISIEELCVLGRAFSFYNNCSILFYIYTFYFAFFHISSLLSPFLLRSFLAFLLVCSIHSLPFYCYSKMTYLMKTFCFKLSKFSRDKKQGFDIIFQSFLIYLLDFSSNHRFSFVLNLQYLVGGNLDCAYILIRIFSM